MTVKQLLKQIRIAKTLGFMKNDSEVILVSAGGTEKPRKIHSVICGNPTFTEWQDEDDKPVHCLAAMPKQQYAGISIKQTPIYILSSPYGSISMDGDKQTKFITTKQK